jgi:hypothetical protein
LYHEEVSLIIFSKELSIKETFFILNFHIYALSLVIKYPRCFDAAELIAYKLKNTIINKLTDNIKCSLKNIEIDEGEGAHFCEELITLTDCIMCGIYGRKSEIVLLVKEINKGVVEFLSEKFEALSKFENTEPLSILPLRYILLFLNNLAKSTIYLSADLQEKELQFLMEKMMQIVKKISQAKKLIDEYIIHYLFWGLNSLGKSALSISLVFQRKIISFLRIIYLDAFIILHKEYRDFDSSEDIELGAGRYFRRLLLTLRQFPWENISHRELEKENSKNAWPLTAPKNFLKAILSRVNKIAPNTFAQIEDILKKREFKRQNRVKPSLK